MRTKTFPSRTRDKAAVFSRSGRHKNRISPWEREADLPGFVHRNDSSACGPNWVLAAHRASVLGDDSVFLDVFNNAPARNGDNQRMGIRIPSRLAANCRRSAERAAWLDRLPDTLRSLEHQWSLVLGTPFDTEDVSCAWVAPARLANGSSAVLKVGMPHMEAEDELAGLLFWNGDPTVHVLLGDDHTGAMLLERCEPGTPLRALPESEQDVVITGLLRRLWRSPTAPHPFRPLSILMKFWSEETLAAGKQWPDAGLVREGLHLFKELPLTASREVLLATDLHAGNVLRAAREPWLVIDPKPFVGDPAYDATQHLFNCYGRLRADPAGIIHRVADLLEVDRERVRLWTFARSAAEPRDEWASEGRFAIARATAP